MHQEFVVNKNPPIYRPNEFKAFCEQVGATTLFDTILSSVTSTRHSINRIEANKLRTVGFIYSLCYCLSQQCNKMQIDKVFTFAQVMQTRKQLLLSTNLETHALEDR